MLWNRYDYEMKNFIISHRAGAGKGLLGSITGEKNLLFSYSGGAQDKMGTLQRAIATSLDQELVFPRGGGTILKEQSHEHNKFQAERRQRI